MYYLFYMAKSTKQITSTIKINLHYIVQLIFKYLYLLLFLISAKKYRNLSQQYIYFRNLARQQSILSRLESGRGLMQIGHNLAHAPCDLDLLIIATNNPTYIRVTTKSFSSSKLFKFLRTLHTT